MSPVSSLLKVLKAEPRLAPVRSQLALAHLQAGSQALSAAAAAPTPFPGQDEAKKALARLK